MKRTVLPVLAAALAALVLAGCGPADDPDPIAGTKPAARQLTEPHATATLEHAAVDPTAEAADPPATPVVTKTVTETRSIGYSVRTVRDNSLAEGKTRTRTAGRTGLLTRTYEVTVTNGEQTARKLVKSVIVRKPVAKVVAVGTKQPGGCDPNYSGACVPVASDVDCAGGGGNGPTYVQGPVRVVGSDIYRLDRDGDGIACDE